MPDQFDIDAYMANMQDEWAEALSKYTEGGFQENWEDGEYIVLLEEARYWVSKSSSKLSCRFTLVGAAGDRMGDSIHYYQSLESVRGMQSFMRDLAALGFDDSEFDSTDKVKDCLTRITEEKPMCVVRFTTARDGKFQYMDIVGLADQPKPEEPAPETEEPEVIELPEEPPFKVGDTVRFEMDDETWTGKVTSTEEGVITVDVEGEAFEFIPEEWGDLEVVEDKGKKKGKKNARKRVKRA